MMTDLERAKKYLDTIPEELRGSPNDLVQLLEAMVTKVNELTAAIQKHKKEVELKIEGRIDPCPEDKSLWGVLKPEVSGTGIQDMMAEVEALSQEVSDG